MGRVIWVGPARNSPPRPWVEAAFLATSAAFYAVSWPGLAGARVRWASRLEPDPDGRPRLFLLWHARIWAAPALFRSVPRPRPALVAHDGVLSRVNQRCGAWSGLDVVVFQRRASARPAAQLSEFVRASGRDLLLAPDSGGAARTIRPGVLELARSSGARVVPLAVAVRGALSPAGQTLLCPGTRLVARHGPPLDASATAQQVGAALRALERRTS